MSACVRKTVIDLGLLSLFSGCYYLLDTRPTNVLHSNVIHTQTLTQRDMYDVQDLTGYHKYIYHRIPLYRHSRRLQSTK